MSRTFTRNTTDRDGRQVRSYQSGCTLPERNTPWGAADTATIYAEGVVFFSTPSHGGFRLSPERLAAIPDDVLLCTFGQQGQHGWFEEDEDWALVALAFPEAFKADDLQRARELLSADAHDNAIAFWHRSALRYMGAGQNYAQCREALAKVRCRKAALDRWNPPGLRPVAPVLVEG